MDKWYFVLVLILFLTPIYIWGFTALPRERWQMICAIPVKKLPDGSWQGLNLTYYGFFVATASCLAVALVMILAGSAGVSFGVFAAVAGILMGICLPAARLIALWVERKRFSFSVGAASFVGIIIGPWLILLMEKISVKMPVWSFESMTVISAAMVGYALGEGMGRLACISFGCCYGKPMDMMPRVIQHYFGWVTFIFSGNTKKISYAHDLASRKIFAIQAVTAVLYTGSALAGVLIYLNGRYNWAYCFCLTITQGWRFCSEFFRSDFRGNNKITAYQIMSLLTIPYAVLIVMVFPYPASVPNIGEGLKLLWDPSAILFLQALWMAMFLSTGRSHVTGSALSFHVHQDRI